MCKFSAIEKYNKIENNIELNNKCDGKTNVWENVNHPSHYQTNEGIEVIDIIDAWKLDFCLGNVIKYTLRAGHKDDIIQDLKKAKWYLEHKIAQLEKEVKQ